MLVEALRTDLPSTAPKGLGFDGSVLRRLRHAVHVRLLDTVERGTSRVLEAHAVAAARRAQEQDAAIAALRAEVLRLGDELRAIEVRDRRDMLAAGERDAVASSARFVRDTMPRARTFPTPQATLAHALELAPEGGLALEFGVYTGSTLRSIAATRPAFGFDSFGGLPEDWRAGFRAGAFGVEAPPEIPGAELVVGLFSDTLPGFLEGHPGPVDLLHLDADLYSSTVDVLDRVGPRLRPGSVVLFDEYLNHPGWENGEHRAWTEYVERTGTDFSYEGFTHDHEQVLVVVR